MTWMRGHSSPFARPATCTASPEGASTARPWGDATTRLGALHAPRAWSTPTARPGAGFVAHRGMPRAVRSWLVRLVVAAVFVAGVPSPASATGATDWPDPRPAMARALRAVLPDALLGGSSSGRSGPKVPTQGVGTMEGSAHAVPASATRWGRGTGRAPGTGRGQLPPYRTPVATSHPHRTGRAVGDGSRSFDPGTSTRVASLSTRTSDLFRNTDGSYTRHVYSGPVNYRGTGGTWTPIDTRLVLGTDQRWHEQADGQDTTFAPRADDAQVVRVGLGTDKGLGYGLAGAASVPAQVTGSVARYPQVLPHTDLVLSTVAGGVKEVLSLSSADAPTSFVFPLRLSGLRARAAGDGTVEFVDGSGAVVGRIPAGYLQDTTVDPRTGGHALSHGVTYTLIEQDGAPAIRLDIDGTWLRDPARRFPVTVDPSFNAAGSGSTYTLSDIGNVDRSGEYQMIIGTWNNGGQIGVADLAFSGLGNALAGVHVSSASLSVFCYWASSTAAVPFWVAPITQSWSVSGAKSYPGPAYGGAIGSVTADPGYWPRHNTNGDQTLGTWMTVPLGPDTFNSWTTGGTNNGLALYAATNTSSWKRFDSVNSVNPPYLTLNYTPDAAPQIDAQAPASGYRAPTLTPELTATAHDADGWPTNAALKYGFTVYTTSGSVVTDSGWLDKGDWTVPAKTLTWGQTYLWSARVSDGYAVGTGSYDYLTPIVPQPLITSSLAQNTGGHGFDPSVGNYTTTVTDAQVPTVGPPLSVQRAYNSLDPRTGGAFGAGWSSVLDMRVVESTDAAGQVVGAVVTYPEGQEIGFGRNSDGSFSPPPGRYARFAAATSPAVGYTLLDKSGTTYTFGQATGTGSWALTAITDNAGRAETFTYPSGRLTTVASVASGRALHLTWSTPSGATAPHVSAVATDAATPGDASTVATWTYAYAGDRLSTVCPPTSATACTSYGYTNGSHYPTAVLDAGPLAYWRLGESSGSTATDAVLANQGAMNATYTGVGLGTTGPLPGSGATAATFDGSSSAVTLPTALTSTIGGYFSVALWFRTTTPNGILYSYQSDPLSTGSATKYGPALYIGSDGKLLGSVLCGTVCQITSKSPVTDGTWHHVVLAEAGTTVAMYLDGTQVGSANGAITETAAQGMANAYVGSGYIGGAWADQPHYGVASSPMYFTGRISDVALFNRYLTPSTVSQLYAAGSAAGSLLTTVTTPAGNIQAKVAYDAVADRVTSLVDANQGTWALSAPTVNASSQSYRAAVLGASPAGYWRLGEASGSQATSEVKSLPGTYNLVTLGGAGSSPFVDATGATLNGTSSYVVVPGTSASPAGASAAQTALAGTGAASIGLWFTMAAGSTAGGVLFGYEGEALDGTHSQWVPALYVGTDGKLRGELWYASGPAPVTTSATVNDGTWHFALISADTGSQTLYLDGSPVGTISGARLASSAAYLYAGAGYAASWPSGPSDPQGHLKGSIADVAVYPSALSGTQVAAQYALGHAAAAGPGSPVEKVTVTDPGNHPISYQYDLSNGGRALSTVDATGARTSYGYDTMGYLATTTDANGATVTTGHDAQGNLVSQTSCQDQTANRCSTTYYTYDTTDAVPDPRNGVLTATFAPPSTGTGDTRYRTSYGYDALGNRTSVTTPPVAGFPNGRTSTTAYTDGHSQTAVDGGAVPAGLVYRVTTPGGATETVSYFHNGDPAVVTDAAGVSTSFGYDAIGRVTSRTVRSDRHPDGLVTRYTYDLLGRPLTETDPAVLDHVTGAVHTAQATRAYDADGNLVSATIADLTGGDASRTSTSSYDSSDRLTATTTPGGEKTTFSYDRYGNRISQTDPTGRTTRYTYDADDRLTSTVLQGYVGDPGAPGTPTDLVESSRAYDPAGRLASVTDAMGWATRYTYTDNGLLASVVRTDGTATFTQQANTYDAAGNLVSRATNNGTTTTSYAVDGAGRTTAATLDPGGLARTTRYTYSPDDFVLSTTHTDGSGARSVSDARLDALGRTTAISVHDGSGAGAQGWWPLDDGGALPTTAADSSGGGAGATPSGDGVSWATDAVALDGQSGELDTAGPVVDTTHGFTVSAWVRLDAGHTDEWQTVVSQDGAHQSAFELTYDPDAGAWSFVRWATDADGSDDTTITSSTPAATGTWTHLVGTYDATTRAMALYVNGKLSDSDTSPYAPWASTGPLAIGRHLENGEKANFLAGSVANVQTYARTLTAAETSSLYTSGRSGSTLAGAAASGWWRLSDGAVSSLDRPGYAQDLSGSGATAQTSGTAPAWSDGAAGFDGTGTALTTADPVLDTTGNYTVSAWVKLTGTSTFQTAVSQDGPVDSAFSLQYSLADNRWAFSRVSSRSSASTTSTAARALSAEAPSLGTWTHLVGVSDASGGTIRLYVDGGLADTTSAPAAFASTGSLAIGRGRWGGAAADFFGGQIADVQVYHRVLSAAEITTLHDRGRTGAPLGAAPRTTRWQLDQQGLPLAKTDPDGSTTYYQYDEAGNLAVTVLPAVATESGGTAAVTAHPITTTGYDTFGEAVESADADGNVIVDGYDPDGRLTSRTLPRYSPPGGGTAITPVTRWSYTALGEAASVTDPLGQTTRYGYDQLGDRVSVTDAAGGVTRRSYDPAGDVLSVTTPTGATSTATYDYLGHRITASTVVRQQNTVETTALGYNSAGYLSAQTTPAGVTTRYGYDAVGERITVTDGAGNVTTTQYDFLGRAVATIAPDRSRSTRTFDGLGNVTGTADWAAGGSSPLRGTSATYDPNGQLLTSTDARSATSSYTYDATGLLTRSTHPVSATASITTSFGYDAAGHRTRTTDGAGNATVTTYNAWGLPESTVEPSTPAYPAPADRTFTVTYDADQRITSRLSPGGVKVANSYDLLGSLTGQTGSGAEAATTARSYAYDADGRLTAAGAGAGTDTFGYDDRGLLVSATGPSGNSSFAYTADGQVSQRTDAAGTSRYGYDGAGRLATIADGATGSAISLSYNALSQVTGESYGTGNASRRFTYDSLHRLTGDTLLAPSGATETSISYGFDLADNETSKTTTGLAGSSSNTYTYDLAGRLTSWNNGTTTVGYTYDAAGNRASAGATTYTYNARNELVSDGTTTYGYTARGTRSAAGSKLSTSDAFDRVITDGGTSYQYDSLDRLLTAGTATFAYSGAGNTAASDGTYTYSRDPSGGLVGLARGGTAQLAFADLHTDVVATFTATGSSLTGSRTFDPFGTVVASTGTLGNLGYQQGWTDAASGAVNTASRWYDPATARFTSRDSVSLDPTADPTLTNRYAYVSDNPLTGTDPSGHCDWWNVACGAQQVASAATKVVSNAVSTVSSAWNTASSIASAYIGNVAQTVGQVYQNFTTAVSTTVQNVKQAVTQTVTTVVNKVSDGYKAVSQAVTSGVSSVVNLVTTGGAKIWSAASYAVQHPTEVVQNAWDATTAFVKDHAADIASFAVGTVVFFGCEAVLGAFTMGVGAVAGAVACGALSGAISSAVSYGMTTPRDQWSFGGFAGAAAIGAVTGAVGSFAGAVGAKLLGPVGTALANRLGPVVGGAVIGAGLGAVSGAAAGAVGGAATYAIGCVGGQQCTMEGLGQSTLDGMVSGAKTGAMTGAASGALAGYRSQKAGSGCGHSFAGTTLVLLADGGTKAIKDIKLGDRVKTTDPRTGHVAAESVVALHDNKDRDLTDVTVRTSDGGTAVLHTTTHHPFWDEGAERWTDAGELRPGTALLTWDGIAERTAAVVAVRTWTGLHDMRDLTVAHIHTYYVLAGTTPVLVHNCTGEGGGTAGGGDPQKKTAVIGRLGDTHAAEGLEGFEVLDLPDGQWSIGRNEEWVQSVVDREMDVYVASTPTYENMWNPIAAEGHGPGPTVFAQELNQFEKAGYTWDGFMLRHPGH